MKKPSRSPSIFPRRWQAFFKWDYVFCTLFIYLFIAFLTWVPAKFEFLSPLEEALEDFKITDLAFSQLNYAAGVPADTNLVLVNIGKLNRRGITAQLQRINEAEPAVVAIDAFFRFPKQAGEDSLLTRTFRDTKNLVLVSKVNSYNQQTHLFDTLETSAPWLTRYAVTGFSNFITEGSGQEKYRTCRSFPTIAGMSNQKQEVAFPLQVVRYYDPEAADYFLKVADQTEDINFKRTQGKYFSLDAMQVLNPDIDISFLKGKIVLMGYMGESFGSRSWEDKFYTPLNEKYAGKTIPDMFGVVAHANIISMILEKDYIDEPPPWFTFLLGVVLCYINVVFFYRIHNKLPTWYDAVTKTIQLVETVLIIFIILYLFSEMRIKIDFELGLIAMLLSGDLLEVYAGGLKNIYYKLIGKKRPWRYRRVASD